MNVVREKRSTKKIGPIRLFFKLLYEVIAQFYFMHNDALMFDDVFIEIAFSFLFQQWDDTIKTRSKLGDLLNGQFVDERAAVSKE